MGEKKESGNNMTVFNLDVHWKRVFIMSRLYKFGFGFHLFVSVVSTIHKLSFRARYLFTSYLLWGCCVLVASFASDHVLFRAWPWNSHLLRSALCVSKTFLSFSLDLLQVLLPLPARVQKTFPCPVVRGESSRNEQVACTSLCKCVMSCTICQFWMCSNFLEAEMLCLDISGLQKIPQHFKNSLDISKIPSTFPRHSLDISSTFFGRKWQQIFVNLLAQKMFRKPEKKPKF